MHVRHSLPPAEPESIPQKEDVNSYKNYCTSHLRNVMLNSRRLPVACENRALLHMLLSSTTRTHHGREATRALYSCLVLFFVRSWNAPLTITGQIAQESCDMSTPGGRYGQGCSTSHYMSVGGVAPGLVVPARRICRTAYGRKSRSRKSHYDKIYIYINSAYESASNSVL